MKVSITGATGHLGNSLLPQLLAEGFSIKVVCRENTDLTPLLHMDLEIAIAELSSADSLSEAFKGSECVLHLASLISIMPFMKRSLERTNVVGTRNVIEACSRSQVRRLIYISSIHAISQGVEGQTIDESFSIEPSLAQDAYGVSKAKATLDVLEASDQGNIETVVICPTGFVGPYERRGSRIGRVIKMHLEKGGIAYVSGAYDFVDVRDVSLGIISSIDQGRNGQHYILSGQRVSVAELFQYLHHENGANRPRLKIPDSVALGLAYINGYANRALGRDSLFTPSALHTIWSNSNISSDLAKLELGHNPRHWTESITDQINWMRSQGLLRV